MSTTITGTAVATSSTGYATLSELAEFLGTTVEELDDDSDRLIERASDLIRAATLGRSDLVEETDTEAMVYLKKACCAQVEYWGISGESTAYISGIESYSIGKVSVKMGSSGGASGTTGTTGLCTRAHQCLMLAGLLYRGVGMLPGQPRIASKFFRTESGGGVAQW